MKKPIINEETCIWFRSENEALYARTVVKEVAPCISAIVINNTLILSNSLDKEEHIKFYALLSYNTNTDDKPTTRKNKDKYQPFKQVCRTLGTVDIAESFASAVKSLIGISVSYIGRNVFMERKLTMGEEIRINLQLLR